MLWVPQKGILLTQHNLGGVGTLTPGTAVTTGATSSTKGTPVELIASTDFDSYWVTIWASGYGNAATSAAGALDIMTGAATEEVIIANLLMGFCGAGSVLGEGPKTWNFPLYIPAGRRISAQAAGQRTSTALRVGIQLWGGHGYPPFRVGSRVTTYGITTVPLGTDVAAGYSGAEGAWVQITASTTEDHFALVPSFSPTDGDTTLTPNKKVYVDFGRGAATEQAIEGAEWIFAYGTGELCEGPWQRMPAFIDIPSGTRLVARVSMSGATDTGEPDVAIHAVS